MSKQAELFGKPLGIRFTPSEKSRLQQEAAVAGLTVGEFVRRCCAGRRITARTDLAMIRELCRLGGLMKFAHVQSGGAYSQDTAAAIRAIKRLVERLAAEVADDRQKNPR